MGLKVLLQSCSRLQEIADDGQTAFLECELNAHCGDKIIAEG